MINFFYAYCVFSVLLGSICALYFCRAHPETRLIARIIFFVVVTPLWALFWPLSGAWLHFNGAREIYKRSIKRRELRERYVELFKQTMTNAKNLTTEEVAKQLDIDKVLKR